MTTINHPLASKLRAIQNLINDSGATEGERDAAQQKLDELLSKYGLTLEDIGQHDKQYYVFKYRHGWERDLLVQIIYKVLQVSEFEYLRSYTLQGNKRREVEIELTEAQYTEIFNLYDKYCDLYKQELEDFFTAFIHKHKLLAPKRDGVTVDEDIDWAYVERIMAMMAGLRTLPMESNLLETGCTYDHD